jgi:hypothetical protein
MAKTESSLLNPPEAVEIDADMAKYENMPAKQVTEELRSHGIDATATIAGVMKLVEESRRRRKSERRQR